LGTNPIECGAALKNDVIITTVYCRDSDAANLYKNIFKINQSIKLFDGSTYQ
jgi:hypothetical protein